MGIHKMEGFENWNRKLIKLPKLKSMKVSKIGRKYNIEKQKGIENKLKISRIENQ